MKLPKIKLLNIKEVGDFSCFSDREMEIFNSFKVEKRRREWYWSRIAAKQLVGKITKQEMKDIEILNDHNRVPYAFFRGGKIPISISHRCELCGCAVDSNLGPIGIDIEKKEKKEITLFSDYLNNSEYNLCLRKPDLFYDIWTLKEASLKMLRLGLSVNAKDAHIEKNEIRFYGKALEKAKILGIENTAFELKGEGEYRIALTWKKA